MSLSDYSSRLQGSLGRYGRDIGTFKDSVFEDKEKEKEELFQHVHAMPANLGNGENDQDHQEFYEDYYYEDYEFDVGRKSSDKKVCSKILQF